jgi:hypothetical protein
MSNLKEVLKSNAAYFFSYASSISEQITINRKTVTGYNPTTGGQSITTVSTVLNGLLLKFRESQIDGTTILREDRRLLIPQSSFAPDTNDEVIISNLKYRIMNVRGDITSSYWDMQIRKL